MTTLGPRTDPEGGRLDVVATPIGNIADLSERARAVLVAADVIYCEDTRRTGRLLERVRIDAARLVSIESHHEAKRLRAVLDDLSTGKAVALVTDAGTPLVSDPGGKLVAAAIAAGYTVSVVPGPSAAIAALVLSGFDVSRFRFEGFLPRSGQGRRDRLGEIAAAACPTVIFESPNRIRQTISDLAVLAGGGRRVSIARELTKLHEEVWHGTLAQALERPLDSPGEHVIVLDSAPLAGPPEEALVRRAVESLLDAGFDAKDAVRAVELTLGASHRVAYAAALDVRSDASRSELPRKAAPRRPVG